MRRGNRIEVIRSDRDVHAGPDGVGWAVDVDLPAVHEDLARVLLIGPEDRSRDLGPAGEVVLDVPATLAARVSGTSSI